MKKTILALIAACAGCCLAALLLPALFAGGALMGLTVWLGRFSLEALLCALPIGLIVTFAAFYFLKQRRGKKACAPDGTCGCK